MSEQYFHIHELRYLIRCRDDLFWAAHEEGMLEGPHHTPLMEAYCKVNEVVDKMKEDANFDEFDEPGWTIYAPANSEEWPLEKTPNESTKKQKKDD